MQMMFSGDWRPSVWPTAPVHSLVWRWREGSCRTVWQLVRPDAGCSVGVTGREVADFSGDEMIVFNWDFLAAVQLFLRDSLGVPVGPGVRWHRKVLLTKTRAASQTPDCCFFTGSEDQKCVFVLKRQTVHVVLEDFLNLL